jgi:hypothetical protein
MLTNKEKLELNQHVAYNKWMRSVHDCPAEKFKISREQLENGPLDFPWNSKFFTADVKNHILHQKAPLFEKSLEEINKEKFCFSPEGQEEGAFALDIILNKGFAG